jgi:hypothetical protein
MKAMHIPRLMAPFAICGLLLPSSTLRAADPSLPAREAVLENLRAGHPRLLASAADFAQLRRLREDKATVARWLDRVRDEAQELLASPPVKYEIPDGKRLLAVSRRAKQRVLVLAFTHQLTGDRRFAQRLWQELDTVTRFQDWNPSHFLDTAEMTFAVAIGYDWMHDVWTQEQRAQLRRAIVELGLEPGLTVYREQRWWARSVHNWNQVCNGGLGVGALAIADEEPEMAAEVLHAALHSVPLAMHQFRPDGGWGEGPGYWRYATEYNVYFLAALRTALGTDFGLGAMPGFPVTGDFPLHFVGPTGRTFNYADARDGWQGAPQLFWLADVFDQPAYAAFQMPYATARPTPLDLLYGRRWLAQPPGAANRPLDRHFRGVSVVTMLSRWGDPKAIYVGFKGGDNRVNHGQLDLGSFVLDADGIRWAIDLGPDDYNIPGYFGRQRWSYYRNSTPGHNTLTVNGQNQSTSAQARIIRFAASGDRASAVADLSAAYPAARSVLRGVALLDRQRVLIQDEMEADSPVTFAWHLHTHAAVHLAGSRAELTQDDQRLRAEVVAPPGARFTVEEVHADPPQRPIRNVRRLSVRLPEHAGDLRLAVVLTPDTEGDRKVPDIVPLRQWPE